MTNVTINGLTAVHAGSNGILTTVDVCNTPPFCQSITYTNIAKSTDAAMTATSVTINGNPACTLTSNFAISNGDSPGGCGGTVSGTVNGMAEFLMGSPNVFIEGIPVVRQTDLMVSNFKNTPPMPLQQPGAGKPPDVSAEDAVQLEAAELPFVVDIEVAGEELKFLKSIVGAVDLDLAPEDEEGEAAVLEEIIYQQGSAKDPDAIRDFKVLGVTGPTTGKVGDSLNYKVTKTDLDDATDAELKTISWKLVLNDKFVFKDRKHVIKNGKKVFKKGKVLKTFLNKGPNFTLKVDEEISAYSFLVIPYTDAPPKESSTKLSTELYARTTIIGEIKKLNEKTDKLETVRKIKPLTNVQFLIVHHTAGNKNAKRDEIEKIHLHKNWDQIGYHKVIEFNGDTVQGRPEELRGSHTKGINYKSLGVNVVGNFENIKPQAAQITSLVKVLTAWCKEHKLKETAIFGHFETLPIGASFDVDEVTKKPIITLCPGENLKNQLPEIRKKVAANLA